MAQLYDCFAQGGLKPLQEIYQLLETLTPLVTDTQHVDITDASHLSDKGRLFAEDIIAPINIPQFANAAVDGYACAYADYQQQIDQHGVAKFTLIATIDAGIDAGIDVGIDAGQMDNITVAKNQAVIIFTGAPMPKNTDMVVMLEDVEMDIKQAQAEMTQGKQVQINVPAGMAQYDNYRPIADDVACGACVIPMLSSVNPATIAMAAALGLTHLPLLPQLKIGLLSSGDELVSSASDKTLPHGKIYDANRPLLTRLLSHYGVLVTDYGIVADDEAQLTEVLNQAANDNHLIISSGGMSEGGRDYIRKLLETHGQLDFLRAAIKPGRPMGIGRWQKTPIIGLPGNPVAAFTVFLMIALPMIMKLQGRKHIQHALQMPAMADFDFKKRPGRVEYARIVVKEYQADTGYPILSLYGKKGAGIISSIVGADGFAALGEDVTQIKKGDIIAYVPFSQFF